jgi:DNA repair exonuclease SbcCD ATPase subunit
MLTFIRLKAEGFCSIGELDLPLNHNGTMLIKAANGFGKSSIFSALVWCIYGKNLKGISNVTTWSKYQPKGYKGVKVEVYFQNKGKLYKIIRCQDYKGILDDGAKGNQRLLIYEETDLVDIKGKNKIQEYIESTIGFSYNLFMNSIMFGQGLKRLIQESNPDKKKIFEEIFDLSFINEAKSYAQNERSDIQQEVTELKYKSESYSNELSSLEDTYKDLISQEESERKELLEAKKKLKKKKSRLTKELGRLTQDEEAYIKCKGDIVKCKEDKRSANNNLDVPLEDLIYKLSDLLTHKKTEEALSLVLELKKAFDTYHKYDNKLEKLESSLDKLQVKHTEYINCKNDLEDIKDDLDTCKKELGQLKAKDIHKLSTKYKNKIDDISSNLSQVNGILEERGSLLKDYDWVIDDPLGNSGIKAYLFDSSLDMVNQVLDSYSDLLGFKIEFSIDLESARKDFVTLIEKDGIIIEYDELSGGEKQLCNIAMAFAMNEVLTSSRGINLAFLDEVFESLSQDNIEVVISLIRHTFENKTLFLITHHTSLPLSNSRVLQVSKVNGLSSYKVL